MASPGREDLYGNGGAQGSMQSAVCQTNQSISYMGVWEENTMRKPILSAIGLLVLMSMIISACAPVAAPVPAPQPTQAPVQPTAAPPPTAAPQPTAAPPPTAAPQPTAAQEVKITWWHIQVVEEQIALWQKLADEYMAAHPNVKIEITWMENEAFKTKMTTVMQSGQPPDIFQSWGGGVMNEYANAGLLKDITPELDADSGAWRDTFSPGALGVYSYKGKNYGVPWDMGMVGFWYNKALFSKAGIQALD
jgi:raffinose/stachyose/melibiose transport system substrate-binding protein